MAGFPCDRSWHDWPRKREVGVGGGRGIGARRVKFEVGRHVFLDRVDMLKTCRSALKDE